MWVAVPVTPLPLTGGYDLQGVNFLMENCILYDWLTFTTKCDGIGSLISLLGLESVTFEDMPRGRNGYRSMMTFEGISILYDGRDDMGICVDMSGKGCRAFETYSTSSWDDLFSVILDDAYNVTRLDVAFDDHTGLLDIDVLRDDTDDHHYVSKSRKWEVDYGSEGITIYHGSKKSDMLIRIYDKAAEQVVDGHWVRVEMQMRDDIATGFLTGMPGDTLGSHFCGVLCNYLRYVEPQDDMNMSRWPMTEYWENFLQTVQRIRCWSAPGVDYNLSHLSNYVINQAGNALDCYLKIFGVDDLIRELGKRSIRPSPKYELLKREFESMKKQLEELKEEDHGKCNG